VLFVLFVIWCIVNTFPVFLKVMYSILFPDHNLDIKCSNGKWKNIRNSTFNNEFTYSVMEIKDSLLSPIEGKA